MAKRYINYLLKDKLSAYLDGLENTEMSFGLKEANLNLQNVKIKEDALTKLKLPVEIKLGVIKRLYVSLLSASSSKLSN